MRKHGPCLSAVSIAIVIFLFTAWGVAEVDYRFERGWPALPQPWYFMNPSDVATDTEDAVYVLDRNRNRIHKLSYDGFILGVWGESGAGPGQFQAPSSIFVDWRGHVYIADTGNNRIQKFDSDGRYITQWSASGDELLPLNEPAGVAVTHAGEVFVTDAHHRVVVFDDEGLFLRAWGEKGWRDGNFTTPLGIAVDNAGHVYIADSGNSRIQKFTTSGDFVSTWGESGVNNGFFRDLRDVAIDPTGRYLYSLEGAERPNRSTNTRVQRFTLRGVWNSSWGAFGSAPGQFFEPTGLTVDRQGNVLIADTWNCRVQRFSALGRLGQYWGSTSQLHYPTAIILAPDQESTYVADFRNDCIRQFNPEGILLRTLFERKFINPTALAFDRAGNILISYYSQHIVVCFNSEEEVVFMLGEPNKPGSSNSHFNCPRSIAIDSADNIYVTDQLNNRIQKFDGQGAYLATIGGSGGEPGRFYDPVSIALDKSDNLYVADLQNHRIQKFSSDGAFSTHWGQYGEEPGALNEPWGLAVDRDGRVHVADTNNHRIQLFSGAGDFLGAWGDPGDMFGRFHRPDSLAVDDSGNVYVTENNMNRIQRFRPISLLDNSRAVIIAGGGPYADNHLWESTKSCAMFVYRTLGYFGYAKSDIYVLSPDTEMDIDGSGLRDGVNAVASAENIAYALTQWAAGADKQAPIGDVVIYLTDHGADGLFKVNETEWLSAQQLSEWLDVLQESISGKLALIYDACEAGSFMPYLSSTGRIVITSTQANENAKFITRNNISFSYLFWSCLFNGFDLRDSFLFTRESLSAALGEGDLQTPLVDATGDSATNTHADIEALRDVFIGTGGYEMREAPVIGSVSAPQTITGTNRATIQAFDVSGNHGVKRVFALIQPPDFRVGNPSNPVQAMPAIDLAPDESGNMYEGVFDQFTSPGTYRINVYARDTLDNTSLPQHTSVTVDAPLRRRAVILGGTSASGAMTASIEQGTGKAYTALTYQGYGDDDIYYFSPQALPGVDALPSLSALGHALTAWLGESTHDLTVYLVGESGASSFYLAREELLTPGMLDNWLDIWQDQSSGIASVILDGCGMGGWLPALTPPAGKERLVVASCGAHESAIFTSDGGISFSNYFWTHVLNGASTLTAFNLAANALRPDNIGPIALLDDTGNGIGNEKSDGERAGRHWIGAGIVQASSMPAIAAWMDELLLSGSSEALLWVQGATGSSEISRVWAVITPPTFSMQTLCGQSLEMPVVDLLPAHSARFEAIYTGFIETGPYQVSFYAMDAHGQLSTPAVTTIVQTSNLGIPDQYEPDDTREEATWIGVDGPSQVHTLHVADDRDWAFFYAEKDMKVTVETINPGSDCDTHLRLFFEDQEYPIAENDDAGVGERRSYIRFSAPESGRFYAEVSFSPDAAFPAGDTGDMRYELRVWREEGAVPPGSLTCTVVSSVDGTPIGNAEVLLNPLGILIRNNTNGVYLAPALPQGRFTVIVSAPGFESKTRETQVNPGESIYLSFELNPLAEGEDEGEIEGEIEGEDRDCCSSCGRSSNGGCKGPTDGNSLKRLLGDWLLVGIAVCMAALFRR